MCDFNSSGSSHAKGKRNVLQLSDGAGNFTFHPNVYVLRNGIIHASGFEPSIVEHGFMNGFMFLNKSNKLSSSDAFTIKPETKQVILHGGRISAPPLSFKDDLKTGIYSPVKKTFDFVSDQNIKLRISDQNVSVYKGKEQRPAFNFGLEKDFKTGFFSRGTGELGISTLGIQKINLCPKTEGDYIDGLNIGKSSQVAGIRRVSGIPENSWEDGYLGDSSGITCTPNEFINNKIEKVIPKGFKISGITIFTNEDKKVHCTITCNKIEILNSESFETNKKIILENENLLGDGLRFICVKLDLDQIDYARIEMCRV